MTAILAIGIRELNRLSTGCAQLWTAGGQLWELGGESRRYVGTELTAPPPG